MATPILPDDLEQQLGLVFERLVALLDAVASDGVALPDAEQRNLQFARAELNRLLVRAPA